jgi:endonuclease I
MRNLVFWALIFPAIAWADPPPSYYDTARGLSGSGLANAIHGIIDDHTVLKYTESGNTNWNDGVKVDVWEALVFTDSACLESMPDCGMVQLLYLDEIRHVSAANRGSGEPDSWEREHVWPKSRGFKNQSQDGYTDLHHLRHADRNINGSHSNYGYDVGGKVVTDKRGDGSEVDSSARLDTSNDSFEPPDRAKGQVARMIFYMAVRYQPGDNQSPENMPDLVLEDKNERAKEPWIGDLCTLLKWHNQFGPNDFERRRNERVMLIQGNRNPFIDEPGWANLIWGAKCG